MTKLSTVAPPSIDEIENALRRRFRTVDESYFVGGRHVSIVHPENAEELINEEDFERDERLPYWADVWPSALVLAACVLEEAGRGRSLLELGCGAGVVSSAASIAGFAVEATDYYADALLFARLNAFRNSRCEVATRLLDWRALPPELPRFDCVVASDVLYERGYGSLVADVLARTLMPDGIAFVADPGRIARPQFVEELPSRGLRLADQKDVAYTDGAIHQTIAVLEVRRTS